MSSLVIIVGNVFVQHPAQAQFQNDFLPANDVISNSVNAPLIIDSDENKDHIPSIYPVSGKITSNFGSRHNPFGKRPPETHSGLDIAAPTGDRGNSTADRKVIFAGWQRGYGNVVIIDHGTGLTTRYGHLSRLRIQTGVGILRGSEIGDVGSTGRSTGAHLHYEVRVENKAVNPAQYLPLDSSYMRESYR